MAKLSKNNKYNINPLDFIKSKEEEKKRENARKQREDREFLNLSEEFNNYIHDPMHPTRLEHYKDVVHRETLRRDARVKKEKEIWIKANPDKDPNIDFKSKQYPSNREWKRTLMQAYKKEAEKHRTAANEAKEQLRREDAEFARRERAEASRTSKTTAGRPTNEKKYGPYQTEYYKKHPEMLEKASPEMRTYQKEIDKKVSNRPDTTRKRIASEEAIRAALQIAPAGLIINKKHSITASVEPQKKEPKHIIPKGNMDVLGNITKNNENASKAKKASGEYKDIVHKYAGPISKGFERDMRAKQEKKKQETWERGVLEGPHGDQYEKNKAALSKANAKIAQQIHDHPTGVGKAVSRYNQSQRDKQIAATTKANKEAAQAKITNSIKAAEEKQKPRNRSEAAKKAYETRRNNSEKAREERAKQYATQRKPKQNKVNKLGKDAEEW